MFRYDIEGYSYGVGKPIDLTYVGYLYINGKTLSFNYFNRNEKIMSGI